MKLGTLIGAVLLFGGGCVLGLVLGSSWHSRTTQNHFEKIKVEVKLARERAEKLEAASGPEAQPQTKAVSVAVKDIQTAVTEAERQLGH